MPFLKRLLLTSLLLLPLAAFSQNSTNYIDLTINTPLNFLIDNASELTNTSTLTNAITIKIVSKSRNCNIYARVTSITGNTSTPLTPGYLSLKFRSASNTNYYNLNTAEIALSYSDQLLFQQTKNGSMRSYYYDFMLDGLGYDFDPGTYGFTVQFTMTQP